jgi:hypothetical protein
VFPNPKNRIKTICERVGVSNFRIVGVDYYPSFLKILPFEVLFRPLIVKITRRLENKVDAIKHAHMLMIIAMRD